MDIDSADNDNALASLSDAASAIDEFQDVSTVPMAVSAGPSHVAETDDVAINEMLKQMQESNEMLRTLPVGGAESKAKLMTVLDLHMRLQQFWMKAHTRRLVVANDAFRLMRERLLQEFATASGAASAPDSVRWVRPAVTPGASAALAQSQLNPLLHQQSMWELIAKVQATLERTLPGFQSVRWNQDTSCLLIMLAQERLPSAEHLAELGAALPAELEQVPIEMVCEYLEV